MRKLSSHSCVLGLLIFLLMSFALAGAVRAERAPLPMITIFDLETGLRPLAMGGAFVGLADDENAVFYNPAGLGFNDARIRFDSLFSRHLGLTSYARAALSRGPFGLGLALLNSGPITGRDSRGNDTGKFSYYLLGLAGAYGTRLTALPLHVPEGLEGLALGLRLKLYRVKTLPEGSGSTLALDPALLYSFGNLHLGGLALEDLRFGLAVENLLGPEMRYGSGHREAWPRRVRAGVGLIFPGIALAADLESNGNLHLGGEYRLTETELKGLNGLALRAGLLLGNRLAISLGLGLTLDNFRLDYALVVNPQLPLTHALALHLELCLDPADPADP